MLRSQNKDDWTVRIVRAAGYPRLTWKMPIKMAFEWWEGPVKGSSSGQELSSKISFWRSAYLLWIKCVKINQLNKKQCVCILWFSRGCGEFCVKIYTYVDDLCSLSFLALYLHIRRLVHYCLLMWICINAVHFFHGRNICLIILLEHIMCCIEFRQYYVALQHFGYFVWLLKIPVLDVHNTSCLNFSD